MTWLACAGTVLGFAGRRVWLCELTSHFRAQYAGILLISAAIFAGERQWWPTCVTISAALVNLRLILPIYRAARRPTPTGPAIRLFFANILATNRSHERLRHAIHATDPDIIVLEEFTLEWLTALGDIATEYPHSEAVILPRGFGIVVFSRWPFERADVLYLPEAGPPPIVARIRMASGPFTVIATHPLSPTTPLRTHLRNQQLVRLAELVVAHNGPIVVVGDLNMTCWSPVFQDFLRRSGLRDSRQGFGLQPSWPRAVPPARIPIDHCLVSSDIVVHQRCLGPHVGSDHLPVIIHVSVEK